MEGLVSSDVLDLDFQIENERRRRKRSELETFWKSYQQILGRTIQDYWSSRTLIFLGCVLTYFLGPLIMILVLVLDLMFQNPNPLYPRQKITVGFSQIKALLQNTQKKKST